MPAIRLLLLLLVLGCLTLLLVQNWSPVLQLVFLGGQTQPLPLALWILFSIVAGAMTSLLITACFNLSNYFAPPKPRKRPKSKKEVEFSPPPSSPESREVNYNTASAQPETSSTSRNSANEWESDTSNDDDWNFEQDINKTEKFSEQDSIRNSTTYEVNTQPKSSSRSGSVYSYSYREPSNSGVGKTESIYDADYRVLTPPYQQANATENEDDWGDEDWGVEDDDFKDEGKSNSSRQG